MDAPRGYIYLLRLEENENGWKCAHKIGRSQYPDGRMRSIGLVLPYDLTLIYGFIVSDAPKYERLLHKKLSAYHLKGEWYWPDPQWVNWFRTLSQNYLDTGEYFHHEPYVSGRVDVKY